MDIAAFITARLDEDEQRANAMEHDTNVEDSYYSCAGSRTEPYGDLPWGEEHCDCFLAERKARALRQVAALRAIVARPKTDIDTLRDIASFWADHPGYDEGRRP